MLKQLFLALSSADVVMRLFFDGVLFIVTHHFSWWRVPNDMVVRRPSLRKGLLSYRYHGYISLTQA
jgi:hypothetical protein